MRFPQGKITPSIELRNGEYHFFEKIDLSIFLYSAMEKLLIYQKNIMENLRKIRVFPENLFFVMRKFQLL